MITRFSFPTDIRFGLNAIEELPGELRVQKVIRPLIVTDKYLSKQDMVQQLASTLKQHNFHASIFGGVFGNPDDAQVAEGCQSYRDAGADAIIAIGGGASIDVAKAIALLVSNPGSLTDYDGYNPQARSITEPLPFLAAAPTTAGTGSEVGRSTVVSDRLSKKKRVIFDPVLLPKLVIADPLLSKNLPAAVTAATGMDALTHLVEAFSVQEFHPMCDGIALEGLRLLGQSLAAACQAARENDTSAEALIHRQNMLAASMMGAVAFQKGLGVNHSIAHALSTVCDLHHGLANALLLPHVIKFNSDSVSNKYERIAQALGGKGQELHLWVAHLIEQIHIQPTLSAHGVTNAHVPDLVETAFQDGCHQTNPKKITKDHLRTLLHSAM